MKVTCPQCGGTNQAEGCDPFQKCRFCLSTLFIDLDAITQVLGFEAVIPAASAVLYLKKDFAKIGFNEEIKIKNIFPVACPFWSVAEEKELFRASSRFPDEVISRPSGNPLFFDRDHCLDQAEIIEVDIQRDTGRKRTLYYVPGYQIEVFYKEKSHRYFVNAVNGTVQGEPLPFIAGEKARRLFPFFMTMFFSFFILNLLVDHFLMAAGLNLVLGVAFQQLSLLMIEKRSKP